MRFILYWDSKEVEVRSIRWRYVMVSFLYSMVAFRVSMVLFSWNSVRFFCEYVVCMRGSLVFCIAEFSCFG